MENTNLVEQRRPRKFTKKDLLVKALLGNAWLLEFWNGKRNPFDFRLNEPKGKEKIEENNLIP